MLTVLILFATAGAVWYGVWQAEERQKVERQIELERHVIRAAMTRCGRVTAIEAAFGTSAGIAEIEECLRRLQQSGACDSELTADGQHIYIFRSFDDAPVRARAIEKEILRLAKIQNGDVRISDLVLKTELSTAEAREWLEVMAAQTICQAVPGTEIFRFFSKPEEDARPGYSEQSVERPVEPPPTVAPPPESPFTKYTTQEQSGFLYEDDINEEGRVSQPRLSKESGR